MGYNARTVTAHDDNLTDDKPRPADEWALLWELLARDSPCGDEGDFADWLCASLAQSVPDARTERLGDSVLAVRGERPRVAVFAHIDTHGYTLGYKRDPIPLGGPLPKRGETVRPAHGTFTGNRLRRRRTDGDWTLTGPLTVAPGARFVYAATPERVGEEIVSPYLDNRAGVWAAWGALQACSDVAVAFTVGEELSGQGAFVCARRLYEAYAVRQALVSDVTWDTASVHCGRGVAVSLRDKFVPRQRFLDRVLSDAEASGIPFQREIESAGGSDGSYIERSGFPISWAFVGAPSVGPHTSAERVHVADLRAMRDLLVYLVGSLHAHPVL